MPAGPGGWPLMGGGGPSGDPAGNFLMQGLPPDFLSKLPFDPAMLAAALQGSNAGVDPMVLLGMGGMGGGPSMVRARVPKP